MSALVPQWMNQFALVTLVVVLVLIIAAAWMQRRAGDSNSFEAAAQRPPLFRKRSTLLNVSEAAFFHELQKQLPAGLHVFPKMRIADIIDAIDGKGFYRRRNYILPKHIDFVICDAGFRPILAIELNGSSHEREDRKERDALITEIFADAKLPLGFVRVGGVFEKDIAEIVQKLRG